MKVIVMGCGRVGSQVSLLLNSRGHQVTIIDHLDEAAEERLGANFKGRIIKGLGFDEKVLQEAGIKNADAFIAASSSDNANIVGARIAQRIYKVPRVVARLFDPRRAEIYQRLGLRTISTTTMGAERIMEMVTHEDMEVIQNFGHGEVSMVACEVGYSLAGKYARDLMIPSEITIVSVTRDQNPFIPTNGTQFAEGDVLHLVVLATAMPRLQSMIEG